VGKLLGDAAKCRARFACIVGAESAQGQVALKDMTTGEQRMVAAAELASLIG
jgi:histidyl-tRNA synthetase